MTLDTTDDTAAGGAGSPTGVVELRVHGVGGATPATLLDDPRPHQVAGDDIAGFHRGGHPHVEAYSWGGLTSRSAVRVLWLLLLPFMLANVAGWMCPARMPERPALFRLYRTAMRWAALAITLNFVLLVAWIAVDYFAQQCGAGCPVTAWLRPSHWAPDHPARRVLLGAIVPLLVIALLAVLAHRSARRYERIRPPSRAGREHTAECSGAAALRGLADRDFWNGERTVWRLGAAHIAASLAAVAVLVAHLARAVTAPRPPVAHEPLWTATLALGGAVLLGALLTLAAERHRGGRAHLVEVALTAAATATLALAAVFAWSRPPGATAPGEPPGMAAALTVATLVIAGLIAPVPLVLAAGALRGGSRTGERFRWGAPFVVLVHAVAGLNAVLLGALIRLADVFGDVGYGEAPAAPGDIVVFPAVRQAATSLIVLPAIVLALFGIWQLVRYGVARFGGAREEVRREYLARDGVPPAGGWLVSAVADAPRWLGTRGWAGRVAGTRRLADAPRELDLVLTALAATGIAAAVMLPWQVWTGGIVTAATAVAAMFPVALVILLRTGWRDVKRRRVIAVLWDVGTFWPRSYHPLAPPSYAERAVPDIQRRLWRLHDEGERVVLVAHSQGTILAAAALAQPHCRPPDGAVALVTLGSPLRGLYSRGFPAYVNAGLLDRIVSPRTPYWENLFYRTDYIGQEVRAAGCRDTLLPDPATSLFFYGDRLPPIRSHVGYWTDPQVRSAVRRAGAALTAHATEAAPSSGNPDKKIG